MRTKQKTKEQEQPSPEPAGMSIPGLSEAVILAVASAFAYGTGWLYRAGQLAGMGVPIDFAEFSVNTGTLLAILIVALSVGLAGNLMNRRGPLHRFEKAALCVVGAILLAIVLFQERQLMTYQTLVMMAAVCVAALTVGKTWQKLAILGVTVPLTMIASYFVGFQQPQNAGEHTIVRDDGKEWILATVFDERLVCVPFVGMNLTAGPGFVVLDYSEGMSFSTERTGRVRFIQRAYSPSTTMPATVPSG